MRRNDSLVADVVAGQFRSHVQCNKCGVVSLTFDPFTCLRYELAVAVARAGRLMQQ